MFLVSYIKAFFIKELEDIIAPLDNIKNNISSFIQKQEIKIEKDATKARDLIKKNETRASNNLKALTISKNLEALLGG